MTVNQVQNQWNCSIISQCFKLELCLVLIISIVTFFAFLYSSKSCTILCQVVLFVTLCNLGLLWTIISGELWHLLRTQVFSLFITQLHCLQFLSLIHHWFISGVIAEELWCLWRCEFSCRWYLILCPHKRNACLKLHDASKAFVWGCLLCKVLVNVWPHWLLSFH